MKNSESNSSESVHINRGLGLNSITTEGIKIVFDTGSGAELGNKTSAPDWSGSFDKMDIYITDNNNVVHEIGTFFGMPSLSQRTILSTECLYEYVNSITIETTGNDSAWIHSVTLSESHDDAKGKTEWKNEEGIGWTLSRDINDGNNKWSLEKTAWFRLRFYKSNKEFEGWTKA